MAGSTQAFPSLSRGPGGCTDPPLGAGLCPCPPPHSDSWILKGPIHTHVEKSSLG